MNSNAFLVNCPGVLGVLAVKFLESCGTGVSFIFMAIQSGTKLGPYEILSPAGAGGMGEVYRAKDTRLDRIVAVSVTAEGPSFHAAPPVTLFKTATLPIPIGAWASAPQYDVSKDGSKFLINTIVVPPTLPICM